RASASDRVRSGLSGADAHRFFDVGNEDFPISDPACLGGLANGLDGGFNGVVCEDNLDFDLGQEVDDVLGAAIEFRVALLSSEALGLYYRDSLQAGFLQGLFDFFELERL